METSSSSPSSFRAWFRDRDWWPLARLLTKAALLGVYGHFRWGWTISARDCLPGLGGGLEIFLFCAFLSCALAYLFIWLLLLLFYGGVSLSNLFYDASRWVSEKLFLIRSNLGLALAGLCGEILLFAGIGVLLRRLLEIL